jgi:hypothetical protein
MRERPVARRAAWAALAASLGLHAVALFAVPPRDFAWVPSPAAPPIEARILRAAAETPAVASAPPTQAAAPTPRPRPVARPRKPAPETPVAAIAPVVAPRAAEPLPDAAELARMEPVSDATPASAEDVAAPPAAPLPVAGALPASEPATPLTGATDVAAAPQAAPVQPAEPAVANVTYPIRRAEIVYDLHWGANPVRIGRVRHTFTAEDGRYRAETVAEAAGMFAMIYGGQYVQRSRGRLGPDGLVPDEYFVMRGKPERAERASFDWAAQTVSFTRRDEKQTADIVPGMQDPISMLHQLYFFQPLPEVAFLDIATSRKVGTYEYERIGREVIETAFGLVETVHLVRADPDADRLELWLDPARGYLPLKLHFRDRKGTIFEQTARALDVVPAESPSGPPARATRLDADR